jgi:transposase
MITLKAVIVTVDHELRDRLAVLSNYNLIVACSQLDPAGPIADPDVAARHSLAALATRWLALHEEIKTHTRHLEALTSRVAPQMLDRFGVGFDSAAELLVTAGDNTDRVHSEAAFAKLCGASPIPAGSGKTSGRHRLNRGGNRQANAALYRIVIVRMRWHPPPSPTSADAPKKASPRKTSSAASNASSPESSTTSSPNPPDRRATPKRQFTIPPARLDKL